MLWLFKTNALSAGVYASQIWSTHFLKHDNDFSNPLQVAHMAFLKRILGIKSTSANWCELRECAQEPLQFYWFRSAVKFWNRMVDSNSNIIRDFMKADISRQSTCELTHLHTFPRLHTPTPTSTPTSTYGACAHIDTHIHTHKHIRCTRTHTHTQIHTST